MSESSEKGGWMWSITHAIELAVEIAATVSNSSQIQVAMRVVRRPRELVIQMSCDEIAVELGQVDSGVVREEVELVRVDDGDFRLRWHLRAVDHRSEAVVDPSDDSRVVHFGIRHRRGAPSFVEVAVEVERRGKDNYAQSTLVPVSFEAGCMDYMLRSRVGREELRV
jgi:hypothetical protein